jgi:hypothetical protein
MSFPLRRSINSQQAPPRSSKQAAAVSPGEPAEVEPVFSRTAVEVLHRM